MSICVNCEQFESSLRQAIQTIAQKDFDLLQCEREMCAMRKAVVENQNYVRNIAEAVDRTNNFKRTTERLLEAKDQKIKILMNELSSTKTLILEKDEKTLQLENKLKDILGDHGMDKLKDDFEAEVKKIETKYQMKKELLKEKEISCAKLEQNVVCKDDQIKVMEENLSKFLDENAYLKNQIRANKDGRVSLENYKTFYEDYTEFKKYVSEKLAAKKDGKERKETDKTTEKLVEKKDDKERKETDKTTMAKIDNLLRTNTASNTISGKGSSSSTSGSIEVEEVEEKCDEEAKKGVQTDGRKMTLVFTTSISKGIRAPRFNKCLRQGHKASFTRFPGSLAEQMATYVTPRMSKEKPETVIIQGGGNDLPVNPNKKTVPLLSVANDIIEAGKTCRKYGARNVIIGSVTTRNGNFLKKRCEALNNILEDLCEKHNFVFVNNKDIKDEHLYDGVHLNDDGTTLLADNYLVALRKIHSCT